MIGLPGCMFGTGTSYLLRPAASFWERYTVDNFSVIKTLLTSNRVYLDTNFTRFYLSHRDKTRCKAFIETVKKIWENRDLIIIEGDKVRLGVGNDLFMKAKSVSRIICPSVNAWSKYDDIFQRSTEIIKAKEQQLKTSPLVLCALGMTATVLAYDLAQTHIQAIDLGHLDIEYSWMLMGAQSKVAVNGKYVNEAKGGNTVAQSTDSGYLSQIIAHIGF